MVRYYNGEPVHIETNDNSHYSHRQMGIQQTDRQTTDMDITGKRILVHKDGDKTDALQNKHN